MKDPQVQDAVTKLKELVAEINELNVFFYEQGLHYNLGSKGGTTAPIKVEIAYLSQTVKYDD